MLLFHRLVLVCLSFVLTIPLIGQCDQQGFNFIFGTDGHEEGHAVEVMPNGDVVVVGTTDGAGEGQKDFYVTRLTSSAEIIWSKTLGTDWNESGAYADCSIDESGIYITGYSQPSPNSTRHWKIIKLTHDGELLWANDVDGVVLAGDTPRGVVLRADGDLMVFGTSNTYGEGSSDAMIMRINADGDVAWCKTLGTYNSARNDHLLSCAELPNENIIAAGNTESWYNSNTDQPWLVEVTPDGEFVGEYVLTSSSLGISNHVVCDGQHIYCTGWTESLNAYRSAFLCKLTLDYQIVWQRNIVENIDFTSCNIQVTPSGDIVLTVQAEWLQSGLFDCLSLGVSSDGELQWSTLVESESELTPGSYPFNMDMADDGHFYTLNHTNGFGLDNYQLQLIKLDGCGQGGCEMELDLTLDDTEFEVEVESNIVNEVNSFSSWECVVQDISDAVYAQELCGPCLLQVDIGGRTLCAGEIWEPEVEFEGFDPNDATWQWTTSDGQEFDVMDPSIVFNETGTYTIDVAAWLDGCEGTASTSVYVYPAVQVTITQDGNTLTASQGIAYQWFLNGEPIEGATNMGYEMTEDGVYSVEVTDVHGCSGDASIDAMITGIEDVHVQFPISVFPNPTSDFVQVICLSPIDLDVFLYDPQGRLVESAVLREEVLTIDVQRLPQGAYFMSFWNAKGCVARRTVLITK